MPLNDVLEKGDIGRHKKLGTIRLGWQEPNANGRSEHPVASDHFVMTDAQYLTQFFGEEPTQLPIFFPFDTFDKNIEAYHRLWAGGKRKGSGICICQGNGDMVLSALPFKATRDKDPDGNDRVRVSRAPGDRRVSYGKAAIDFAWDEHKFSAGDTVPCPGGDHDLYTHCAACNPSIVLKVMIRDVRAARFGYWQISTRSLANYKHFVSVWDSITDAGLVYDTDVQIRITPTDVGGPGPASGTGDFTVDNNTDLPSATIITPSTTQTGNVEIGRAHV